MVVTFQIAAILHFHNYGRKCRHNGFFNTTLIEIWIPTKKQRRFFLGGGSNPSQKYYCSQIGSFYQIFE